MQELAPHYTNEETGISYTLSPDGYYLPDLTLPDDGLGEEIHIGIWGQRRLDYLKKYRKGFYTTLLTSGKLRAHLHEIDTTARERWERMIAQTMKAEGVTEQLKAENAMLWVGKVNNIRNRVEEFIRSDLIYN
ncbi:MAG: TnpV protein [Oscillospiraceae bacterium]|jgi:ribosomal protein S6|nr:TnpV protein [Oscillospiraceae bacterium]